MKTSEIFKVSYGVTLGFLCAKFTMSVCCGAIKKLCDVGIGKITKDERNRKVSYKPYYTNEKRYQDKDNKEKKYSLMESIDDGMIKVYCETSQDLKDLVNWFDRQIDSYGLVSINDLKEFVVKGFSSFEYKDQIEGWCAKAYSINRLGNSVTFDIPVDISDLVFDPDKDIEEEDKDDEVEASE